jgi:hypothetical protein
MSKNKTTEEFIINANKKHAYKYDYSLVNYVNAKTKVKIICPEHGEFMQTPRFHIIGQKCPKCSNVKMDLEYFILKSNKLHNYKYDYSLVEYKNNKILINIICPVHGNFKQKPKDHLLGKGCSKCAGKNMNTEEFIINANKKHAYKYDYSLVNYVNAKTKVKIICPEHGEFMQTPNSHNNGKGCPICKESKGETHIRKTLNELNIDFKPQHKFIDCVNKKELPFDFYLPKYNTCVEYHGEQHYKPVKHFGGAIKFLKTKTNDSIKLNYCLNKGIKLIIINDINKIYDIIKNQLV